MYGFISGVFEPPVDGVYYLSVYAITTTDEGPIFIKSNEDVLCSVRFSFTLRSTNVHSSPEKETNILNDSCICFHFTLCDICLCKKTLLGYSKKPNHI